MTCRKTKMRRCAAAAAILVGTLLGCSPGRAVVSDHPPASITSGDGELSQAHGTSATGDVTFSREMMGKPADNAAQGIADNTPRVVPFHKLPPPRELPSPDKD